MNVGRYNHRTVLIEPNIIIGDSHQITELFNQQDKQFKNVS